MAIGARVRRAGVGFWVLALFCTAQAMAQDGSLYEGEADVSGQGEAARAAALPEALGNALVRLTGDTSIEVDPVVLAAKPSAAEWMEQYRYRQDAGGQSVLIARFEQEALNSLVARAGRHVWPSPRPTPVVWLAIDDGRGPRMLSSAQSSAVAPLTRRLQRRGLAASYPLLDLEEQQRIVVSAFWAGDSAAARRGTPRYQSRVSLVGKLFRAGSGWGSEWRVYDGERLLAQAEPSALDAASILRQAADFLADTLGARAAQYVSDGKGGSYDVEIADLRSAEDLARVMQGLRRMSVVRGLRPVLADSDHVRLQLDLTVGVESFSRMVEGAGWLDRTDDAAGATRFVLLHR